MIRRLVTALSALILGATPALADPFNINISNGESSMLLLTVTDMNFPSPKVAYSGSINSGQMIAVYINGENGASLGSGSNLTVNAPSSC